MLYYKLEHELKKEQIIVSDEKITEYPLSLELRNGTIFAKSVEAGSFEKIVVYPDIFVNVVLIRNLRSNISLLPKANIQKLIIFYTPLYPIKAFIKGESGFGPIEGEIDLKAKKGFIDILSQKPISFMKQVEKGRYRYEFSY